MTAEALAGRVTAANVDLSNCERELIQFCNAVQPHAVLLTLDPTSGTILQASANVTEITGLKAADAAGRNIEEFVIGAPDAPLSQVFRQLVEDQPPQFLSKQTFAGSARNIFVHRHDGVVILEIEKEAPALFPSLTVLYSRLREGAGELQRASGLQQTLERAVQMIARCTGFERVMAYKFLEDGSGHVVAECVKPGLESYLGLHYPASDIPAPARRLFSLTWLRHLPDVDYAPVPIEPAVNPASGDAVDLSYAFSRSVSVMYTQYLKNMGVRATMVFTLLKHGKLWGLISCMQHSAPHHVQYEVRAGCELLGHALSLMLSAHEDAEEFEYSKRLDALKARLIESLIESTQRGASVPQAFLDGELDLVEPLDASGFALVLEDAVETRGRTPPAAQILELSQELAGRAEDVWSTDHLAADFPSAAAMQAEASGVLAARISRRSRDFLFWFRPEYVRTVRWAGNPEKPVEVDVHDGAQRLRPRESFAVWKTDVKGKSKPWRQCEVSFVRDLRRAVVEVILETARQHDDLAEAALRWQREVEVYLALASHDLKEPLRGIHNYATFVARSARERLNGDETGWLKSVLGLTQQMDRLIENLLAYSRAGQPGRARQEISALDACRDAAERIKALPAAAHAEVRLPEAMPVLRTDPLALQEIFFHLLSNAVQYNDKDERWVQVGSEAGRVATFFVQDNGIGIPAESQEQVFRLFQRLHRRDEFGGGAGVGLAIARRLVEQLGGRMWVSSAAGEGSTFYFTIGNERA